MLIIRHKSNDGLFEHDSCSKTFFLPFLLRDPAELWPTELLFRRWSFMKHPVELEDGSRSFDASALDSTDWFSWPLKGVNRKFPI